MTSDLLQQLEQKVAHAVEVIELLRLHNEELELLLEEAQKENATLKTEHDKWRRDLLSLIKRFDKIEVSSTAMSTRSSLSKAAKEEELISV